MLRRPEIYTFRSDASPLATYLATRRYAELAVARPMAKEMQPACICLKSFSYLGRKQIGRTTQAIDRIHADEIISAWINS